MLARLPRLASRTTPFTIRLAIRSSPLPFQHVRFHSSASNPSSDASAAGDGSLIQNPRELIAAKAKAFEEKYKDKLKLKQKEEGAGSLEELKVKKKHEEETKKASQPKPRQQQPKGFESTEAPASVATPKTSAHTAKSKAPSGSPIQPLDQILNMPALLAVPHSFDVVSTLWQTLHTAKSQSSPNRYLSATIPSEIYNLMLASAKAHPIFVLPLPRPNGGVEYFFIQWTFYDDGLSTVIFTSLEEYKLKGTWARSFLTLTHWTDLSEPSGAVLMRGEITSTTPPKATIRGLPGAKEEKGVASGSEGGERYLLTLPDAQLLLLGLQRFYNLESGDKADRGERKEVLEGFSAGTWGEETFKKLNRLAVGSLSGIM